MPQFRVYRLDANLGSGGASARTQVSPNEGRTWGTGLVLSSRPTGGEP